MNRKLIIFGNGLGMALDQDHFKLEAAIQTVWNKKIGYGKKPLFKDEEKDLFCRLCKNPPSSEKDLKFIQQVITAYNTLNAVSESLNLPSNFLKTKQVNNIPEVFRKFVFEVSKEIYKSDSKLEDAFVDPLIQFISNSKSHVATLNYDKLLYEPFISKGICKGNNCLVDGVKFSGFDEKCLDIKKNGLYLHLHGSPKFYKDVNGKIASTH